MYEKEITKKQTILQKKFNQIIRQQEEEESDDVFSMEELKGTEVLPGADLSQDDKEILDMMKKTKGQILTGKVFI
jgi:hypothetical protein